MTAESRKQLRLVPQSFSEQELNRFIQDIPAKDAESPATAAPAPATKAPETTRKVRRTPTRK